MFRTIRIYTRVYQNACYNILLTVPKFWEFEAVLETDTVFALISAGPQISAAF